MHRNQSKNVKLVKIGAWGSKSRGYYVSVLIEHRKAFLAMRCTKKASSSFDVFLFSYPPLYTPI